MIKSDELLVALVVLGERELFVVGRSGDIRRLSDAGAVERAWDIKLDNGHRPYPVLKKRVDSDISDSAGSISANAVTAEIAAATGLSFADNLHLLQDTYLFRPTPAFWSDLWVDFGAGSGLPAGRDPADYYAVYRGWVTAGVSNIKFIRL